ncbi:MAG: dihydrofolate reductase [Streptococcaceae bacterium]|nr:dihydrofolate reductase [Streptococcaceae bacterium]
MIIAIWAEDKNHLIGIKGRLPWRLPAELKHFKEQTMGQVILMGRKTYEGMNKRILPGRQTLILTRDASYDSENDSVIVMHSREEVIEWYKNQDKDLFIIGGAEIYHLFIQNIEKIYQTQVDGEFEGDTYFPADFPLALYKEIKTIRHEKDDENSYAFTIITYIKEEL